MNGRQNLLFRPSASSHWWVPYRFTGFFVFTSNQQIFGKIMALAAHSCWLQNLSSQQHTKFKCYSMLFHVIPSLQHTTKVHHLFCDQLVIHNGFGRFVYRLGIVWGMVLRGLHLCKSRVHETEHQQEAWWRWRLRFFYIQNWKTKRGGGGPRQNHEHGSNQTPHSGKKQSHLFKALCPVVITISLVLKNPNPGSDPHTLTLSDPSMLA